MTVLCAAILEIFLLLFGQGFAVVVGFGQSIPKIREAGRLFGEFSRFKVGLNIENNSGRGNVLGVGNATVRISALRAEIHNKLVVLAHNALNDAAQSGDLFAVRHSGNIYTVGLQADISHVHKDNHAVRILCVVGEIQNIRDLSVILYSIALSFGEVQH